MKVKALSRSQAATQRECSGDLRQRHRNLDPVFHPLQRPREYTRALNAAKINRMFAQPLIGNLGQGHQDAVTHTSLSRNSLLPLLSASADGTLRLWDLQTRSCVSSINAHKMAVKGVVFGLDDDFYSCSTDGTLRKWTISNSMAKDTEQIKPDDTWQVPGSFYSIDHHWTERQFITASDSSVQLWSPERSSPIQSHSNLWGSDDTVHVVRFNPAEPHLVANCSMDRGIGLHDLRAGSEMKKTILRMRSNDLQWNPMEPLNFAVANEDYQAYTFDMRKLDRPSQIFKGHTSAVMSLSWAPTGREFVTGSYDRTIRVFNLVHRNGFAREIYHTKRMQRVFTVSCTMDNAFIVSGSDDTNLRLWKARASEKLGQLTTREESAMQYRNALIRKYQHLPEVKRIYRSRKIPKVIQKQTAQAIIQKESADRKQGNRIKHSKPGSYKFESERLSVVNKEIE